VDGRNPAPADRWFIPLFIGFQPSKVMQDFYHPQYFLGVSPFSVIYSHPKNMEISVVRVPNK